MASGNSHAKQTVAGSRDGIVLAALTLGTALLAGVMLRRGLTTWLEAASFVTGAVCVWLTVRQSVWNFPIGIVNVATFLVVFLRARLYADATLQILYIALGFIGWYLWLFGGAGRTALPVTRASAQRKARVALAGLAMWGVMYLILRRLHGAAPALDALTTALSLCAQWLLDRKHVENWYVWIAADLIYVPLSSRAG
jgi:nicotinamide mononucleotide transporter